VEHVRSRLGRQICSRLANNEGETVILTLSPAWEEEFHQSLTGDETMRQLAMAPSRVQDFVTESLQKLETAAAGGATAAIVTSARIRPFVRSIMERVRTQTSILSQNEIHPHTRLRNLGQI